MSRSFKSDTMFLQSQNRIHLNFKNKNFLSHIPESGAEKKIMSKNCCLKSTFGKTTIHLGYKFIIKYISTVKPVYKGHRSGPENVHFTGCCLLYTGSDYIIYTLLINGENKTVLYTGADPGGVHPARAPPKIGKKYDFFWRKIVIFHTKYPKKFCASLRNWKKYDFLA